MVYELPQRLLDLTFQKFRNCGRARTECQVLWTSKWESISSLDAVVHPAHQSHAGGFVLDQVWLHQFWLRLGAGKTGIRVQVHTHPGSAFHSSTDDAYPIIHTPGFLSLVIPGFGMGPVGFRGAYLAELRDDGRWHEALISEHLKVVQ